MSNIESIILRLFVFLLGGILITTAFIVARINPLEVSLIYLALIAVVVAVGLLTNTWGGLLASTVGASTVLLFNQFVSLQTQENNFLNISSELAVILIVGPLAGTIAVQLKRVQHRVSHWLRIAKEREVHDETLGILKPEWAGVRLEEELLRAVRFQRPLAVVLLELNGRPSPFQAERVAALQALIRITHSVTQPPCVIAHAGGGRVLLVLPEHTLAQARTVLSDLEARFKKEPYFTALSNPSDTRKIGKPLGNWGYLHTGLTCLNGKPTTARELIEQAYQALEVSKGVLHV